MYQLTLGRPGCFEKCFLSRELKTAATFGAYWSAALLLGQVPVSEQVREEALPVVERKRQAHGRLRRGG